jgi:hypothetical protein
MDSNKQTWLKHQYISSLDGIVDCDPQAETVTFEDGTTRQLCSVYSRVMGYHSRLSQWNKGKKAEHADRVYFKETTETD